MEPRETSSYFARVPFRACIKDAPSRRVRPQESTDERYALRRTTRRACRSSCNGLTGWALVGSLSSRTCVAPHNRTPDPPSRKASIG